MIGLGLGILGLFVVWLYFGYREDWETGVPAAWVTGLVFTGVWFLGILPNTAHDSEGSEYFVPIKTEITKTDYRVIIDENGKELTTFDSHKDYLEMDECTQFYRELYVNYYGLECDSRIVWDTSYINEKLKEGYFIKK
jgi:hypothetical protein